MGKEEMMRAVHLVAQGKGGVGKSVVARLLAEHLQATGQEFIAFDADPVNQSFAAVEAYGAKPLDLLDKGGQVETRRFDDLMEQILALKKGSVVIDTGASSFLPMVGYLDEAEIVSTLTDAGFEVFIHTVVTGGSSRDDTVAGMVALGERFGADASLYVWVNEFFGSIDDITETAEFKKLAAGDQVSGVMVVPMFTKLKQEDFAQFLALNVPFGDAIDGNALPVMVRSRLKGIRGDLLAGMSEAFAVEDAA